MRPAVFLDRDGTMVHDAHFLRRREDLVWYPYTVDAVRLLNRAGFAVCVTTNQGGIGLGLFTEAFVLSIHEEMTRTLTAGGAHVDGWFFCPHHPEAITEEYRRDCECRKPRPGLVNRAQTLLDLDLSRSFVVGDKLADAGLAVNAGVRGVLVRTGEGDEVARRHHGAVPGAEHIAEDLMAATSWILRETGHPRDAA
jgi:D-glycero-D-manno-heptose 1,7-bisphosphate phosphatase